MRLGDTAVTKMTTLNLSPPLRAPRGHARTQWDEARSVFPIYLALAKQLTVEVPFPPDKRHLPEKPDTRLFPRSKHGSIPWISRFSSINFAICCR